MSWVAFENQVNKPRDEWPNRWPLPYVRFNIDLHSKPPKLDAVGEMINLQRKVQDELKKQASKQRVQRIANQLIASTFYFHKESTSPATADSPFQKCHGSIRCRFDNDTSYVRNLGKTLLDQRDLYFLIEEDEAPASREKVLKFLLSNTLLVGSLCLDPSTANCTSRYEGSERFRIRGYRDPDQEQHGQNKPLDSAARYQLRRI